MDGVEVDGERGVCVGRCLRRKDWLTGVVTVLMLGSVERVRGAGTDGPRRGQGLGFKARVGARRARK